MATPLLIDTDVLIDDLRDYPAAVSDVEAQHERCLISVVTVAELYAGVREGEERARLEQFPRAFEIIPLDLRLAVQGGLYRRDYRKSHNVGSADALIAATATQRQVPLVTLNRKHFPMLRDVIVPYQKAQHNAAPNQGLEPTRKTARLRPGVRRPICPCQYSTRPHRLAHQAHHPECGEGSRQAGGRSSASHDITGRRTTTCTNGARFDLGLVSLFEGPI
jgi:predicted nucleic acid-binding protein